MTRDAILNPGCSEKNKRGRKLKMLPADHLLMFVLWLKNGLSNLDFISWLFNSNKSTVAQMLITWINYSISIWTTKD